VVVVSLAALVVTAPTALAGSPDKGHGGPYGVLERFEGDGAAGLATTGLPSGVVAERFRLLGHNDLGAQDSNGDVWVHGDFAYVGTWSSPCNGRGVKIADVSRLRHPTMIGTVAARAGTSAEDVVVRRVRTPFFRGDLLGAGIQRCGDDPALDNQQFGIDLWDVSDPYHPTRLSTLGVTNGGGGVHELDLVQRGRRVYALLATPFSEWFDPVPEGDFRIVDVTNPRAPIQLAHWGAGANGLSIGPFFGIGSFGATYGHSARVSEDGKKAYVSYWDAGVLTFDIRDPANPILVSRTQYDDARVDGDGHSMTEYRTGEGDDEDDDRGNASSHRGGDRDDDDDDDDDGRLFILQNDEDFDPRTPARIRYGVAGTGIGNESAGDLPLWLVPGHSISAPVIAAANDGCNAADYPAGTAGKIAVVRTPFPFFDPVPGPGPLCLQQQQDAAAAAAGAVAVVHDFISTATSPQWFDFAPVGIPVLFTDHATAQGMIAAGSATLTAPEPSWGFLRIFDAESGVQVAKFDGAPNVHTLPKPDGDWSIHNTEVTGDRAYSSWYSNGVVALDLAPLGRNTPGDPFKVGQFIPAGGVSHSPFLINGIPEVWGVAIRRDGTIFLSDMNSGLWIVRPTGRAAPSDD
jgi:hypothetical protein